MRRILCFPVLALAWAATPAAGQIVRGQILEESTDTPIHGAMIVLLDMDGRAARRVLTDGSGGFIIEAPQPGPYRIRIDRIGYENFTTERFDAPVGVTFQRISVPIRPVELAGIAVETSRRCELRNEQGEETARVWDEARKALQAAEWTLSSGVYRYTLLQFERRLASNAHTIVDEDRRFQRGTGQAPYRSLPAQELVEEGFVRQNRDQSFTYYAPDAAAFLSDEFLDTHCMNLEQIQGGLVGLAFQPVQGRRVPDIRGTLWIDAATAALRRLEFSYVNLPLGPSEGRPGGEVRFGGLPNGTWIVREWSIRMPEVTVTPDRRQVSVTGYSVQGGLVWRVTDTSGRTVLEAEAATVSGTVVDSTEAGPVEGAVVRTEDGTAEAVTGGAGSFFLPGLTPGHHSLEVHHPSLDSLGLGPARFDVAAEAGRITSTRLRLRGIEETLAAACEDTIPTERRTAMLLVRVRRGTAPAAGLPVSVEWIGSDREGFDVSARAAPPLPGGSAPEWQADPRNPRVIGTILDERGIFMLCAVPTRSQVRVQLGQGVTAEIHRLAIPAGARAVVVSLPTPEAREP